MADSPPVQRRLTALDRAILAVNGALRSMGAVGFETQMHVELAGRLSGDALRNAFARVAARYPIIAARLRSDGGPAWELPVHGHLEVIEVDMPTASPEDVHAFASQRLSLPHDLTTQAPLIVHLLHRPGAGDVLLLQYSHLLMDNMAAGLLVRELDHAFAEAPDNRPIVDPRGLVRDYLRRFPHARRRQAGQHIVQFLWRQFRLGAVLLNPAAPASEGIPNLQMLTASMDASAVNALRARLIKTFGYPCMSMAILASTFRLISQHALPTTDKKKRRFLGAGIGVDLGLRGESGPIFQNLMTMIPMFAGRDKMADRDELTRLLSQQLRDALRDGLDLGFLRFSLYPGMHAHTARWLLELFFRYGFSLWFAHFGNSDFGDSLGGIPIDAIRFVGPCWSPLGFTLLTNQHAGKIHFQVTHVLDVVPTSTAQQILQGIIADLQA